jgi:hypothetical protein
MSRPLLSSAILATLAFLGHVRPSYLEDWPQLSDAKLASRGRKILTRGSNGCTCTRQLGCAV